MTQFGRMKNSAEIGDLVEVKGYYGDLFVVESWTHELAYEKGVVIESIIYDLTDVDTHEFLIAYQEDITVIEKAKNAWKELDEMRKEKGINVTLTFDDIKKTLAEMAVTNAEDSETSVDILLDEINDYKALIGLFGDDSGEYQAKIELAKEHLRKMTQKEADK